MNNFWNGFEKRASKKYIGNLSNSIDDALRRYNSGIFKSMAIPPKSARNGAKLNAHSAKVIKANKLIRDTGTIADFIEDITGRGL